ncbi:PREDICTED: uncharacterized protein LOC109244299 [Nicotiana attenuata]|uniref:uncharacterized protein LOC109244299 n=1 Tax=Nicotiana attenuata TaxID=49451 RepID=UPI000904C113|nr:PREDICTED: uncharacterized protein LOC109244299 [Nicotiana attenuata]
MNDYSLFTKSTSTSLTVLAVYVDDILLDGDDVVELDSVMLFFDQQFKIKDLGTIHYFLGLEVTKCPHGYIISQQKFTNDLLAEFHCKNISPIVTPLDASVKLYVDMGAPLTDPSIYRRIIGKLNFLKHTRPDLSFCVQHLSQFLQAPQVPHMFAALHVLSKKHPTVSLSSTKVESRALRKVVADVSWLVRVLGDLGLHVSAPVPIYCDSLAALHIFKNPVFHERTKHIEIDCHYVRESLHFGLISLHFAPSSTQLANIMAMPLPRPFIILYLASLVCYHPQA